MFENVLLSLSVATFIVLLIFAFVAF